MTCPLKPDLRKPLMGETDNKLIPFQLHRSIVGITLTTSTDAINRVFPDS
ncbi:hypothetical protein [Nostoc sp. C052]|nr:hypothetical protein [Nostoc sp. C052]